MLLVKYLKPLLAVLIIFIGLPTAAQKDCDFQMVREGIKVYTCKRNGSNLKAVRAYFELDATLDQYAAVVLDVDDYKYWNYAASNPKVLERINEEELIYYSEVEAPWPVTDRFVVLHLTVRQDPETGHLLVKLKNVPERLPSKEGFVRVREYNSILEVSPSTNGKLKVDYYLEVDPGGAIPAWATNLVSTKFPINTFSNLRKRIKSLKGPEPIGQLMFSEIQKTNENGQDQ